MNSYQVTYNLTKCNKIEGSSSYVGGSKATITLVAWNGYIFVEPPTFKIGNVRYNFTIPDSNPSACQLKDMMIEGNSTVTAVAVEKPSICNISYEIQGCSIEHGSNKYNFGESVNFSLKANDNKFFNELPTLLMNGKLFKFTWADDVHDRCYLENFIVKGDCTIEGEAVSNKFYNVINEIKNTTINSVEFREGLRTIIITADAGYTIEESTIEVYIGKDYIYEKGSINSDKTVWSIQVNINNDVRIIGKTESRKKKISSFVNLYLMDSNSLKELTNERFIGNITQGVEMFDYGRFITSALIIPFSIPDDMINDAETIKLGSLHTDCEAPTLNNFELEVDIGSIRVDEKYRNVYDYKNVKCLLHLPYGSKIEIEPEYVVNHTISIKYKINLYNGKCSANIISDFTNEIIETNVFQIATKIPFIQEQFNSTISSLDVPINSGLKNAFIEITRNVPYHTDTIFGNECVEFGALNEYKGFIKVSDIMLNIHATNDEKEEIEKLLNNGVYINERV